MSDLDRRSSKTRRRLKKMLIKLLKERGLQHISVQELTDAADISRGTFYLHYRDIFDLYQAIEDDVISSIEAIVAKPGPVTDEDALRRMMDAIFAHLSSHHDAYEALLKTDSTAFLEHLFERVRPSSQESWPNTLSQDRDAREFAYTFVCYGFAGMLKKWMDGGMKEPPARVAAICQQLARNLLPDRALEPK